MTSPYRVLQVAKDILNEYEFCKYNTPNGIGYARNRVGNRTDPRNATAVQFTLMGALARAATVLADDWVAGHGGVCFDIAFKMLKRQAGMDNYQFFRHCDKIGRNGCIALIDKVLDFNGNNTRKP